MNRVEVCLTPELIHQHDLKGKVVVVVDIFRATSCIVAGLAYGIESIYPVPNVQECFKLGKEGLVTAGERGGKKIDGFDMGNSPYEYMSDELKGKSVAVTTTNGTRAILASTSADSILIGAFLNIHAIASHLGSLQKDLVIHCAGWKGTVNIEDTLFAGALIEELKGSFERTGDSALLAEHLFQHNKDDLQKIAIISSHGKRLAAFGIEKELEFCMQGSLFNTVPYFEKGRIKLI